MQNYLFSSESASYTNNCPPTNNRGCASGSNSGLLLHWDPVNLWRRLPCRERQAFLAALTIGIITHLFLLTNLLPNHDATVCLYDSNDHLSSGRWSLSIFSTFSWFYEMPVVIGLLAILALALSAMLTVRFLEIHSSACIFLISGFLVTFPAVSCTFGFLYTADAYFLGVFLNVASVCMAQKKSFGWWFLSALSIAVALGIYQSYIGYAVGLLLFDCILGLLSQKPVKEVTMRGIRYIFIILASLFLYKLLLAFFLWKRHIDLADYSGMTSAINSGVLEYLRTLPAAYQQVFLFLVRPSYLIGILIRSQRLMFLLAAGCVLFLVIVKRLFKELLRLSLFILGVVLLPAALNLIYVIGAGNAEVQILGQYSFVLAFVFALKAFELTAEEVSPARWPRRFPGAFRNGTVLAGLALCVALVWGNFCLSNAVYFSLHQTYENSYATGIRIADRLETLEGYVPGETPVLLNGYWVGNQHSNIPYKYLESMRAVHGLGLLSSYAGYSYLNEFCGIRIEYSGAEQERMILDSGILDSMPPFPEAGCVRLYQGIAIVKLS